jgi:basic membrane protein A
MSLQVWLSFSNLQYFKEVPWMKKNCLFGMVISIMLMLASAVAPAGLAAAPFRVGLVTNLGGIGDKSFIDAAHDGLKKLQKELGIEFKIVESNKMEDYIPNLKSLADQKYDIIWGIGFLMKSAMEEVAKMYPNQKFGLIDEYIKQPNVACVTFKEEEGSFLVGVIAGLTSKKKSVGFIGGMDFPVIRKFEAGFTAGVKAVNPKIIVRSVYAGSFDNPAKGKELANAQFTFGSDIVYHAAGATGLGVISAAKEKGKGYWACGVDRCQHETGAGKKRNAVLTCMIKRVDTAIYKVSADAYHHKFHGGKRTELGIAEHGVGICAASQQTVSAKVRKKAAAYQAKIIAGKINVPTDPKMVK